jgi:hypothetical protein
VVWQWRIYSSEVKWGIKKSNKKNYFIIYNSLS